MTTTIPAVKPRESRILSLAAGELRAVKKDGGFEVAGYAAKFNVVSHDLGGFREKIAPGTFARAITEAHDATFLWMHDRRTLMARVKSGTLKLEEDAVGLKFVASIADTRDGQDLFARMSRGDVTEMSFTFGNVTDEWDFSGPIAIRTLKSCDLYDVSAVDQGAYPETELGMRSLEAARAKAKPAGPSTSTLRARMRIVQAETAMLE